jgi:hypothetical protein
MIKLPKTIEELRPFLIKELKTHRPDLKDSEAIGLADMTLTNIKNDRDVAAFLKGYLRKAASSTEGEV